MIVLIASLLLSQAPVNAAPSAPAQVSRLAALALWPTLTGVALAGTGGAFFLVAGTKTAQLGKEGELSSEQMDRLRSDRRLAENRGIIFSLFGGAALALGGTMYLLGLQERAPLQASVTPLPGGAALLLRGEWH